MHLGGSRPFRCVHTKLTCPITVLPISLFSLLDVVQSCYASDTQIIAVQNIGLSKRAPHTTALSVHFGTCMKSSHCRCSHCRDLEPVSFCCCKTPAPSPSAHPQNLFSPWECIDPCFLLQVWERVSKALEGQVLVAKVGAVHTTFVIPTIV